MKKSKLLVTALVAVSLLLGSVGSAFADHNTNVPGAVYGDQHAQGFNKDHGKIKEDLEKAGVKDLKADHWAAGSVSVLVEAGLLAPDVQGNLNPDAPVNSAEGVAVFAKVLGVASKSDDPATATEKAKQAGLIDPNTQVDRDMTRVEVARLIAIAMGIQPKWVERATYPFNDWDRTSPEDRQILAALYEMGIFKGFPDRTFRPDGVLTKAQIAILVDRILGGGN